MNNKITRLNLKFYRNYLALTLEPNREQNTIVITGLNGSGKTNILEAISLLSPGRGIRGCSLSDIHCSNAELAKACHINSEVDGFNGLVKIDSVIERSEKEGGRSKRAIKANGVNLKVQSELSEILAISWLTPQHDQLFISSSQIRRKFWDRVVQNFIPSHAKNLLAYEYSMRERAKLLKDRVNDDEWLSVLERNMAQHAVEIAKSRIMAINYINESMNSIDHLFPKARITLSGNIEKKISVNDDFSEILDEYISELRKNRNIDMITGRTNAGIHKSDLLVYYQKKNMEAGKCSTGEQKSLLLSIFLADVFAQIKWRGRAPILLLDEVLAHLDEERREVLCQIVKDTGAQTWITGTEEETFKPIKQDSQFFRIEDSKVVIV